MTGFRVRGLIGDLRREAGVLILVGIEPTGLRGCLMFGASSTQCLGEWKPGEVNSNSGCVETDSELTGSNPPHYCEHQEQ